MYTCGSNEYSQLGHNSDNRKFNEVSKLDEAISWVSCGGGHTAVVTECKLNALFTYFSSPGFISYSQICEKKKRKIFLQKKIQN